MSYSSLIDRKIKSKASEEDAAISASGVQNNPEMDDSNNENYDKFEGIEDTIEIGKHKKGFLHFIQDYNYVSMKRLTLKTIHSFNMALVIP
jgi:hypothetical protein